MQERIRILISTALVAAVCLLIPFALLAQIDNSRLRESINNKSLGFNIRKVSLQTLVKQTGEEEILPLLMDIICDAKEMPEMRDLGAKTVMELKGSRQLIKTELLKKMEVFLLDEKIGFEGKRGVFEVLNYLNTQESNNLIDNALNKILAKINIYSFTTPTDKKGIETAEKFMKMLSNCGRSGLPTVLSVLRNGNKHFKKIAVEVIIKIADKNDTSLLISLIDNEVTPSYALRIQVVKKMEIFADANLIPPFVQLASEEISNEVREEIIRVLKKIKDKNTIDKLKKALEKEQNKERHDGMMNIIKTMEEK